MSLKNKKCCNSVIDNKKFNFLVKDNSSIAIQKFKIEFVIKLSQTSQKKFAAKINVVESH